MPIKTILLASNTSDKTSLIPVAKILKAKGFAAIIYECDQVAKGVVPFEMRFEGNGAVVFSYGGQEIIPATIAAAWFRRPTDFRPKYDDVAKELCLSREKRESQDLLFRSVKPEAWINSPDMIGRSEHKLWQLQQAERFGFEVPRTVVANNWEAIRTYFKEEQKFIFKMPFGELYQNNQLLLMGAKVLTPQMVSKLSGLPFPGICQSYIMKKREWRVTVIGENVFPAAIYTTEEAKVDWREHQRDKNKVQFKKEAFSKEVSKLCIGFLKHLGLRFGAFDFIEDYNGNIVFLEVNSNGQYGWLEDTLDLRISEAIAQELCNIAACL